LELGSFQRRRDAVLKIGKRTLSLGGQRERIFISHKNEINLMRRRAAVSTLAKEVRNEGKDGGREGERFYGERRGACGLFFFRSFAAGGGFRAKGTRQPKWGKVDMEGQYRQTPKQGNAGAGDQTGCNLPRMAMDGGKREKEEEKKRGGRRKRGKVGDGVSVESGLGSFRCPSMTELRSEAFLSSLSTS
jgi:hypothetical protein